MLNLTPSISFQNTISGTWGSFQAAGGTVAYILTKARLGTTGTDDERRLTGLLRPVREVLNPATLNFNQLLQRDLDDHRVATELVPYLLQRRATGPAFFPPVMAVLLPFSGKEPVDDFPDASAPALVQDPDGMSVIETRVGSSYRVRRLALGEQVHPTIALGKVSWNDERAKLVVIDGQHRAMALLAVDRTINDTWGAAGSGERYSHFYQARVQALLKEARETGTDVGIEKLEVPVVVAWFPSLTGAGTNAHKAARKLFVDLNKEARQPSEARLTLLSDARLLSIFTRTLLNRLREPAAPLPIYAVEYDNPDRDSSSATRWSVVTSLTVVTNAVKLTVYGPDKVVNDMGSRLGGRPGWREMNRRMQRMLALDEVLPATMEVAGRPVDRDSIGDELFPPELLPKIVERMYDSWGRAILEILGNVLPFRAHTRALDELEAEWVTDGALSSLAKESTFLGVGMFWTLRSSREAWNSQVSRAREDGQQPPPMPEIAKGWSILEEKRERFEELRAKAYLDKSDASTVSDCNEFFSIANTQACQLGAILAFAALAHYFGWSHGEVAARVARVVEAWNAALLGNAGGKRDRRLIFARSDVIKNPINRIHKLDVPMAVYFRYFWLELLMCPEALARLDPDCDPHVLEAITLAARSNYFRFLVDEQMRDLSRTSPTLRGERLQAKARAAEADELRRALRQWFRDENFDRWLEGVQTAAPKKKRAGGGEDAGPDADGVGSPEEGGIPDGV